MFHLTVCSYLVMYAFQSESTLYMSVNFKVLLTRSRRDLLILSDCNWTRNKNHLVRKRTLNRLGKLAKWYGCFVYNYLNSALYCMLFSCQMRISE